MHAYRWQIIIEKKRNSISLSMEESKFMAFVTFLRALPFYLIILTILIKRISFINFHILPTRAIRTTPLIDESPDFY